MKKYNKPKLTRYAELRTMTLGSSPTGDDGRTAYTKEELSQWSRRPTAEELAEWEEDAG
jgi:hypothetical protein